MFWSYFRIMAWYGILCWERLWILFLFCHQGCIKLILSGTTLLSTFGSCILRSSTSTLLRKNAESTKKIWPWTKYLFNRRIYITTLSMKAMMKTKMQVILVFLLFIYNKFSVLAVIRVVGSHQSWLIWCAISDSVTWHHKLLEVWNQ